MGLLEILDSFIAKVDPEWKAIHRVADKYLDKVASAYVDGFEALRNSIDVDALAKVEDIRQMPQHIAWTSFSKKMDSAYLLAGLILSDAGLVAAKYMPEQLKLTVTKAAKLKIPKVGLTGEGLNLEGSFNMRNPRAVQWSVDHVGENIRQADDATKAGVNEIITHALNFGGHPRETARQIRQYIGLTENQIKGILNYQAKLDQSGRSKARVDAMVDSKIRRKVRERALTISRTETIAASCAGQQLHWEDQLDKGYLNKIDTMKEWIVTPDDRLCPICSAMAGQKVDIDASFDFGNKAPPRHPRCRCAIGLVERPGQELEAYEQSAQGQDWSKIDTLAGILPTITQLPELVTANDYEKGYTVNGYNLTDSGIADKYNKVFENMTQEEKQAFKYYTKKGTYSRINRYLRGETSKIAKDDAKALKHMESGFSKVKSQMTQDSILYRGLEPTSFKATFGDSISDIDGILERFSKTGKIGIDDYKTLNQSIGKKVTDTGYGSATSNKKYEKRKLYMEILVDKTDDGVLPLRNLSEFKHESEILLNKNSQYEIVGFKERVMRYEQIMDSKGNWVRNPDLDKKRELVVVVKKFAQSIIE